MHGTKGIYIPVAAVVIDDAAPMYFDEFSSSNLKVRGAAL